MAITSQTVSLTPETLEQVRAELRARGMDGWLLFDFRAGNPIAGSMLGLPALTRRYFAWLPAEGEPVAITHRIEQQPWSTWRGRNLQYSSWRELDAALAEVLGGRPTVAMEYAEDDAVPYVDRVPAGVIELVRRAGANVVSSGDLVSTFYSRWTPEGEAGHRRAAQVVRDVAHDAFVRLTRVVREGGRVSEWDVRGWIREDFERRGLKSGIDSDVAVNANAANPHYAASAESHAVMKPGDLVLIDLWGKEDDGAVYADQTWMGYLGDTVPERLDSIFRVLVDARESAIRHVVERHAAGHDVRGFEVDDVSRAVVETAGYGPHFIHRTGHSIDRDLHGSGPNIDNLETKDTRTLIPGIGFSIEPGIYLPGEYGFRTEVDVYMGANGPEVTTPQPQHALYALFRDEPFA